MAPLNSTDGPELGAAARAPDERASRVAWLAMLGVTALFLAVSWLTFDEIEEDAFIYYRVAENLAHGAGFTFNRGAPPIECSSSLTYQLLLVPFAWLSLDPILSSKLLGIGLGVLALLLTHHVARRLMDESAFTALPPLFLAVSIPFYHWSQRGLETPLYVCVLLGAVACALHPRCREHWYVPAFALVCTRPEGLLPALGFVALLLPKRRELAHFWRGLLAFVGLCVALLALRLLYFHDLVPNPFYTKLRGSTRSGLAALWAYARSGGLLWLVAPGVLAALAGKRWSKDAVLVAGMALVTVLWAVMGEDWKPYNRHLVPALPFLALLATYTVSLALTRPAARAAAAAYFAGASAWILLGARAVHDYDQTWPNPLTNRERPALDWRVRIPSSDRIGDNLQATAGKFLNANYPAGITVVYDQMGQTPWYAGLDKTFVDTMGLVSREVGVSLFLERKRLGALELYRSLSQAVLGRFWPEERRALGLAGVLDSFFAHDAELILIHQALLLNPKSVQARLYEDPRLRERYRQRFVLNGAVLVFERKGFAAAAPLKMPEGCTVVEL